MDEAQVTKAIIPIAGLGTRFLPMSKVLSKEFFPLADRPIIQYIVEEMKESGIKEIAFVVSPKQKAILSYFDPDPELEKMLEKRKKEALLKELRDFESIFETIKFTFVTQKNPGGDGHAILQAQKFAGQDPVVNSFGDDVVDAQVPAALQLINIFKTCNAPVVALKELPREKVPAYGMVVGEKIASNLYKIKKIVEKPDPSQITSNMVVFGRHILTPEVFQYLKNAKPSEKGEIILAEVLNQMLNDGKFVYGCQVKGEWLECGDKLKWLKSFFYTCLKHEKFGPELRKYIKELK